MRIVCCAVLLTLSMVAAGQSVPAAIYTDPPADAAHPASMTVLHIPSHGVEINGLLYAPPGSGKHPTLVICHGLPGTEKNLDLAQAVRRAGWNAVTFNYRGVVGQSRVVSLRAESRGRSSGSRLPARSGQRGAAAH
jgi:predicted alpha/beta-fold hydrolase